MQTAIPLAGYLMVTLGKGKKTVIIAFALLMLVLVPTAYFSLTYREPAYLRYYVDPASAIHITSSGDIKAPNGDTSGANIHRNGNIYSVTGDVSNWLIVEKSNIVLNGNGFRVGGSEGISILNVSNVTVQDLATRAALSQFSMQHADNCTLRNIKVTDSSMLLSNCNDNLIKDCSAGISLSDCSYNKITNCSTGPIEFSKSNYNSVLFSNCSYSGRSIALQDSSDNLIYGNKFWGMAWWISMYGASSHNLFVGNDISMGPRYYADSLTADNYIYHNNFLNFAWNQTLTTPANVWSQDGKGNYWANYNGTDNNHDGIGDTPYVIDQTNIDTYPLMAPINIETELIPTIR